jgi:hypothetical protein
MVTRDWGNDFGDEVKNQYDPDKKQNHSEAGISHNATSPQDGANIRLTPTSFFPRYDELFLGAEK